MTLHDPRGTGTEVGGASFNAYYYQNCCGRPYERNDEWLAFFGGIADRLVSDMRPRQVLDAGCALGLLVETLRDRGVEAFGVDVSSFAIAHVDERVRPYCRHGSITEPLGDRFDLIVCIEVVEHMSARDAEVGIAQICNHADDIVFSSSPSDFKEPTHVNVHAPGYWAQQFARHGFYRDVDYDASFITPWAARFRKINEPTHRIVADYERRYWELLLERNDVRTYSTEVQDKLSKALDDLEAARANLRVAHVDLETTLAALREERAAAAARNEELLAKTRELMQARDTIANMKRSLFWKARRPWAWLRGLFV